MSYDLYKDDMLGGVSTTVATLPPLHQALLARLSLAEHLVTRDESPFLLLDDVTVQGR